MKMTKKIMSLAIVFAMVMAMSVSVFAAGETTGSITINDAVNGEVYNAYKIFDVVYSGDNYAYTMAKNSDWKEAIEAFKVAVTNGETTTQEAAFELTASATNPDVLVVTVEHEFTGAALAAHLNGYLTGKTADANKTAEGTTVKFENLALGYYFLDTSLGSLCALDTTNTDAVIYEKNENLSLDKKIWNGTEFVEGPITADKGNEVKYQVTVDVTSALEKDGTDEIGSNNAGFDKKIIIHDTLDTTNLTFNNNVVVKNGDKTLSSGTDYNVVTTGLTDGCTFHIELTETYVKTITDGAKLVITYSADIKTTAATETALNNTAWLTYSNQTTVKDTVVVKTFEVNVFKYTGVEKTALEDATFVLKKVVDSGNEDNKDTDADESKKTVYYNWDATNGVTWVDSIANATKMTSDAQGALKFDGLMNDTYYLEETKAPDGYNLLTTDTTIVVNNANWELVTHIDDQTQETVVDEDTRVMVENKTGTELPSTGGIGTTIFYALGGLMAVGAGVLLVAKKRMEA